MDPEISIEDAKASMGNATFLQDQMLAEEGAMMSEETAPTDEELNMDSEIDEVEEMPEEEPVDPEVMKEELKQEIISELRQELLAELEDGEETEAPKTDTETD